MGFKKVFAITRLEFLWVIAIIMLGLNMYWSAIVIQPVLETAELAREDAEANTRAAIVALQQNNKILKNGDENTAMLQNQSDQIEKLVVNQLLVLNATKQQNENILESIEFFRANINETYIAGEKIERAQVTEIFNNLTAMAERVKDILNNSTL